MSRWVRVGKGGAALLCLFVTPSHSALPAYTSKLGDDLWEKAEAQVEKLGKGSYEGNTNFVCGAGTWGDGPQCNQWDQGRSPCWPSSMTVSATWDTEVMELWSREMAQEFGGPGRGQLGPGINVARFPWNGRLGEYMAGEDPYFGAQMVATMVRAARKAKNPPLQVAKHFIPNTIEKDRNSIIEEVDERTLFEVYYPPFDAAVEAGVAGMMCSYNLVNCTTGRCSKKGVYACASSDVLNEHLKGIMGFKGMVISDWDATKCQDAAADSPGCTAGGYIDNKFAAEGGLDLEMPDCMTFGGGVTERAKEKAMRMQWSYLVQDQSSPGIPSQRRLGTAAVQKHTGKTLKWSADTAKCFQVSWDGDDSMEEGMQIFLSDCDGNTRQRFSWSKDDKKIHWASHPSMCLGVKHEKLKEKSALRVWKCDDDEVSQDYDLFGGKGSKGSKGKITSVADPKLCVHPSYNGVALGKCSGGDDLEVEAHHVRDTRPTPMANIHHTNAPGAFLLMDGEKCLQAGSEGGFPYNGLKIVFEKCSAATEQRWLWYSGNSTIQAAAHPGMCVDVTDGKFDEGTPLQIWECVEGNKHQVFQMFDESGKLPTLMQSNMCVGATEVADEDEEQREEWNDQGQKVSKAKTTKKVLSASLAACSDAKALTLAGVSFQGVHGQEDKPKWVPYHASKPPMALAKSISKVASEPDVLTPTAPPPPEPATVAWTPPPTVAWTPPPTVAWSPPPTVAWVPPTTAAWTEAATPSPPDSGAAPAPSWHTGVYDWKTDNPFGSTEETNADAAPSATELAAARKAMKDGPSLEQECPDAAGDNFKSDCKLALADRIIAEATVVLKNKGGVLPLTTKTKVALVGKESCAGSPLAQGGGSGWNGFACNQVPKINVKKGIKALKGGPDVPCPDDGNDNSLAEMADVVLIVVVPEKAEEGRDRSTIQLHPDDKTLIKKYSKIGKKVVVAINAPGPLITNTWDDGVDAIVITWLPGVQNGKGIAMALYNQTYGASGRLPFTFPKCVTSECSKEDELKSAMLGDQIKSKEYVKFAEKALIGYRWYQAKGLEVSYPFGFGLFAYGSAEVKYTSVSAAVTTEKLVEVTSTLTHDGPAAAKDVPQLYISFPDTVPGDANSKPKWVLKGFTKVLVEPNSPTKVTFRLTTRDLSYWDDSTGKSHWVCAEGTFTACVGADANAATQGVTAKAESCTSFDNPCSGEAKQSSALPLDAIVGKEDVRVGVVAALPGKATLASNFTSTSLAAAFALLASLAAVRVFLRRRNVDRVIPDGATLLTELGGSDHDLDDDAI